MIELFEVVRIMQGWGNKKIGREFRCNKFDYFNFFKIVCLLLRVLKGFD